MKKIAGVLFLSLMAVTAIQAQTADELIAKNTEARGGLEKLKALNSLTMEGSMNQGGVDVEMKFYYLHNKATKVEFTAVGQTGYNIITSTEGWAFNPFAGNVAAEAIPEEQVKAAQAQLDLQGALIDYQQKGSKVEYLGKESVQGTEYYKLKLTRSDNRSVLYYLDKDYLVARTIGSALVGGEEQEVTTEYGDYRKTPEGYVFPFKRSNGNVDITFSKIEINPNIDPSIFKP